MRSNMAALVNVLISNFYLRMKNDFPKERHECWEESPLEEINLRYAAVDGYVSFELYRKLKIIERGRAHLVPIAPLPPAPQPPIATYCPNCLEKEEEESSRGAKRARQFMSPPGSDDEGAPSALAGGSGDDAAWKKQADEVDDGSW